MEAVIDNLVEIVPSIVMQIARFLAVKLMAVDGISPKEQAAITLLDALEAFLNAPSG